MASHVTECHKRESKYSNNKSSGERPRQNTEYKYSARRSTKASLGGEGVNMASHVTECHKRESKYSNNKSSGERPRQNTEYKYSARRSTKASLGGEGVNMASHVTECEHKCADTQELSAPFRCVTSGVSAQAFYHPALVKTPDVRRVRRILWCPLHVLRSRMEVSSARLTQKFECKKNPDDCDRLTEKDEIAAKLPTKKSQIPLPNTHPSQVVPTTDTCTRHQH